MLPVSPTVKAQGKASTGVQVVRWTAHSWSKRGTFLSLIREDLRS